MGPSWAILAPAWLHPLNLFGGIVCNIGHPLNLFGGTVCNIGILAPAWLHPLNLFGGTVHIPEPIRVRRVGTGIDTGAVSPCGHTVWTPFLPL